MSTYCIPDNKNLNEKWRQVMEFLFRLCDLVLQALKVVAIQVETSGGCAFLPGV